MEKASRRETDSKDVSADEYQIRREEQVESEKVGINRSSRKDRQRRRSEEEHVETAAEMLINSLNKNNMEKMKNNYVYYDKKSDGRSYAS